MMCSVLDSHTWPCAQRKGPKDGDVHKVTLHLTHQHCKTESSNTKLSSIQKRISRKVYPEKFLLFCSCHFSFNFIFSISFHMRNPFALLRLICHRLSGLIFFPDTVSTTYSIWLLIRSIDLCEWFLLSLALAPVLPLLPVIQSPHLCSQSWGWKLMAPP